jgi:ADP-ribose pyrophosphatase YjhB (NUDIX family)
MLVNRRGHVLLQQRDDRPDLAYANHWTLFGGQVEEGETPEECIRRELKEELDLDLPVEYWTTVECPARTTAETVVYNHLYVGKMTRPIEELTLYEGAAMAYFDRVHADRVDLAFMQSPLLMRFFDEYGRESEEG